MNDKLSVTTEFLENIYSDTDDPWNFETSDYEQEKYKTTIDALPRGKYKNVLEIGCSIGVLSEMLAKKCDRMLCIDPVQTALNKAGKKLSKYPFVTLAKMTVPQDFPNELFDLVVVSEVGYYLSEDDLKTLIEKIVSQLEKNGQLILVHWTPVINDYPLTGDYVHESFLEYSGESKPLKHIYGDKKSTYRLDLMEKN